MVYNNSKLFLSFYTLATPVCEKPQQVLRMLQSAVFREIGLWEITRGSLYGKDILILMLLTHTHTYTHMNTNTHHK